MKNTNNSAGYVFPAKTAGLLAAFLSILLFAAYPLALIFPVGSGVLQRFYFAFPVMMTAGFVTLLFLILSFYNSVGGRPGTRCMAARIGGVLFCLFFLVIAFSADRYLYPDILGFLALFAVPVWIALGRERLTAAKWSGLLSLLWLFHSGHLLWEIFSGQPVIGLTGNRNWMANLSLALAPWPWFFYLQWKRGKNKRSIAGFKPGFYNYLIPGLILAVTFAALWFGRSRAVWGLLVIYGLWLLITRFLSSRLRTVVVIAAGLGLIFFLAYRSGEMRRLDVEDIRIPLWRGTVEMIKDHPVAGVGAGNFRADFPVYRRIEQMASPKAAPITDHPHNEVLHLAASLGIPLAVGWLLLAVPPLLLFKLPPGAGWKVIHFSAFICVGHGMLDLTLARPPASLLALICLGLLWRPHLNIRATLFRGSFKKGGQAAGGSSFVLTRLFRLGGATVGIVLGIFFVGNEVAFQWFMRQGAVAEVKGEERNAYQAYIRAREFVEEDVRPFYYAGNIAFFELEKTGPALRLYKEALAREPDFDHLNRNIAFALSRAGRNIEALGFFKREAELFPYDHTAQDNVVTCQLTVRDFENIERFIKRAVSARRHRLLHARAQAETMKLIDKWRRAVKGGHYQRAVDLAEELTEPVIRGGVLPDGKDLVRTCGLDSESLNYRFRTIDAYYWRWLVSDHYSEALESGKEVPWLRAAFRAMQIKRSNGKAVILADEKKKPKGLLIYEHGELKLESLLKSGESWRVSAFSLDDEGWEQALSHLQIENRPLRLLIPVSCLEVIEKNRTLAMVLRGHGINDILPSPLPPSLQVYQWERSIIPQLIERQQVSLEIKLLELTKKVSL